MELENSNINEQRMDIRLQIDKGKKKTIIEYDMTEKEANTLVKALRKKLTCGGHISYDTDGKWVSILNGDHRHLILNFMTNDFNIDPRNIKIHGG